MSMIALILSMLLVTLGTLGLVSLQRLADLARRFLTPGGLVLAAVIRILFGVVLVVAAPNARAPEFVRVIGIISIVAGGMTPCSEQNSIARFSIGGPLGGQGSCESGPPLVSSSGSCSPAPSSPC